MDDLKIFLYPGHQVVLEGPLDDLVQKIRRQHLVDIRAWEIRGKGLRTLSGMKSRVGQNTHLDIANDPPIIPQSSAIVPHGLTQSLSQFMCTTGSRRVKIMSRSGAPKLLISIRLL